MRSSRCSLFYDRKKKDSDQRASAGDDEKRETKLFRDNNVRDSDLHLSKFKK